MSRIKRSKMARQCVTIWRRTRRLCCVSLAVLATTLLTAEGDSRGETETADATSTEATAAPDSKSAQLIPVPLPIIGNVDTNLKRMIDHVVDNQDSTGATRPILILEFRAKRGQAGEPKIDRRADRGLLAE